MASMLTGTMGDTDENQSGDIPCHPNDHRNVLSDGFQRPASLKSYLDSGEKRHGEPYINAIEYAYSVTPQIYKENSDSIRQVHPDRSFEPLGLGSSGGSNSMMSSMMSTNVFYEMPKNESLYRDQYDVTAGRWPEVLS